jgi:hypothetical protein
VISRARSFGLSRATLRKAALTRCCQPGPRLRKWATTSRSSRIDTSCLVGVFCGPRRRRRYAATISGATSMAGRARAHISSVISDASGSRAIPALISASSSSVISRAARSARRRAATHTFFDRPGIPYRFLLIGLAQADDSDGIASMRVHKQVNAVSDESPCTLAQFSVILAIVDGYDCQIPFEFFDLGEIDFMFGDIARALDFVPIVGWGPLHGFDYTDKRPSSQVNRKYDLQLKEDE